MALLTRKKTPEPVPAWHDDPTLAASREKSDALDQKLAAVSRDVSTAETAMFEARETFEEALLQELLEKVTSEDVATAKVSYVKAQELYESLKVTMAPLTRACDRLRQELAPLEAAAKNATLARLRRLYGEKVAELDTIFTQAEAANQELVRLYRLAQDCVPPTKPWAGLPDLSWRELTFNENAQDGGKLGHWRVLINGVLNNGH